MVVRHNLGQFAGRMRKVARDVEPAADETLRKVALVVNQTLVLATPVDTGRARANWRVSIDTEVTSEVGHTSPQTTLSANQALIQSYRGGALIIQNNVPYVARLNQGSSAQAPAGFVERAIQSAARAVQKAKVVR